MEAGTEGRVGRAPNRLRQPVVVFQSALPPGSPERLGLMAPSVSRNLPPTSPTPGAAAGGRLGEYLDRVSPEVVAATYWFTPATKPDRQLVTIRFTGRGLDVAGRAGPRDQFVHDQRIADVLAGSGPVAVTAKIRDVNPGEWEVRAKMLTAGARAGSGRSRKPGPSSAPQPVFPGAWSWWRSVGWGASGRAAAVGGPRHRGRRRGSSSRGGRHPGRASR